MSALIKERSETRAIQPCYDALNTSNWKSGIAQCNKAIKSIPSGPRYHIVLSLLALYHLKNHDTDQAKELCSKLEAAGVDNADALKYLRIVMTDLGRAKQLPNVYQNAYNKNPSDLELGVSLCYSYVVLKDWENVQKTAFKLSKTFDDPRPVYWAAFGLLAQANKLSRDAAASKSPPPKINPVLLTLARTLVTTAPDAAQSPSHIHLFVKVLIANADSIEDTKVKAKHLREAWTFLESDKALATGKGQLEVEEVRWEVVKALGALADAEEGDAKMDVWELEWKRCDGKILGVNNEPRDFNHMTYLHLIDLALFIAPQRPDVIRETRETFSFMTTEVGGRERGPLLASLELETRLAAEIEAEKDTAQEALPSLIKAYFQTFSSKPCCFEDLQPFLLTEAAAIEALQAELQVTLDSQPASAKEVYTLINAHKVDRYVSEVDSAVDPAKAAQKEIGYATLLMELHRSGLEFGKDLVSTELQPADDLAILAVNALARAWHLTNDSLHLFRAIVFLEHAQRSSGQNHYLRLLLIRMYRLLGAPSLTYPRFKALKIASVQHDTLSHVVCTRWTTFGAEENGWELKELARRARKYYESTDEELPEMIMGAFGNESYPQITDFVEFEERIRRSLERKMLVLDTIRSDEDERNREDLSEILESLIIEDLESRDNRDFKLTPSYQPRGAKTVEALTAMGPEVDEPWLRAIASSYLALARLPPRLEASEPTPTLACAAPPASLTTQETALFDLASHLLDFAKSLDGPDPHAVAPPAQVVEFFSNLETQLRTTITDGSVVGWEILHAASIALEGYAFVQMALRDRRSYPSTTGKKAMKVPSAVQQTLVSSKASLRSIASLLRTAADAAGSSGRKAYAKSCSNMGDLAIEVDFVTGVAAEVGNAKKAALLALGKQISEEIKKE